MSAARLGLNGFPRVPRVIVSFNLGGARIALGPESSTECARSGRDKPRLSTPSSLRPQGDLPMAKSVSVAEAKRRFSDVVGAVRHGGQRFVIERD